MKLTARGLNVKVEDRLLLTDVDVDVSAGEVLGLIGPNGAGKTTLLRVLAGITSPDRGSVCYDGQTLADLGRQSLARRLAFLPQYAAVEWPVQVENLVALGRLPHRSMWGDLSDADVGAIESALARTGTRALRRRSVGTLSSGERMRVLVARLLAVEAEILLADEPVATLDPYFQLQFMDLFTELAREGRGVVLVLHDLALAARYCDRILMLNEGQVAACGPPDEVLTAQQLESVYHVKALVGYQSDRLYLLPWEVSEK